MRNITITFGKHKGLKAHQLVKKHPDYVLWFLNNLNKQYFVSKAFIYFTEQRYGKILKQGSYIFLEKDSLSVREHCIRYNIKYNPIIYKESITK